MADILVDCSWTMLSSGGRYEHEVGKGIDGSTGSRVLAGYRLVASAILDEHEVEDIMIIWT